MLIEDFAAISLGTSVELSSKDVENFRYRIEDVEDGIGSIKLNYERGCVICDPQQWFVMQLISDFMNTKVVTKNEVYFSVIKMTK